MSGNRYLEKIKIEAVKLVTERSHAVAQVAATIFGCYQRVDTQKT